MARKNYEQEGFIVIVISLAIIGLLQQALLQINLFYQQHQILFFTIAGLLIFGGGALVYFLDSFFKNRRNKKWLAIERIEDMQKLHWREFEEFIAFVLQKKGFKAKVGAGTKDGGVDVEASLNGRKYLVQCKKWQQYKISEPNVREFLGAISDFDIDAKGIYVTTSHLTSDAKLFAERNSIAIWDKYSLEGYVAEFTGRERGRVEKIEMELIETVEVESSEEGPICNRCGGRLIKRMAERGPSKGKMFLGCENYPRCKNTVNL